MKYSKQNKKSIKDLFNTISSNYDLLNNLISFNRHKSIKTKAVKNLPEKNGLKILDLCTGTGDIAILLSKKYPDSEIIAADFSEKMLGITEEKTKDIKNISTKNVDVTNMPFEEDTFDLCFISFGLRNLPEVESTISTINKVLKPDGIISILDLGYPKGIIAPIFHIYFNFFMPLIAKLINNNSHPYKYLVESVKNYPPQEELLRILEENGFKEAKNTDYFSGIIAQQIAYKK